MACLREPLLQAQLDIELNTMENSPLLKFASEIMVLLSPYHLLGLGGMYENQIIQMMHFHAFILGNLSNDPREPTKTYILPSVGEKRRCGKGCLSPNGIKSLYGLLAFCPAYCYGGVSCSV